MTMFSSELAEVIALLNGASEIGGRLGEATAYHLASGGRGWRAQLALDCGLVLGQPREGVVRLALACELAHQASVVHDDAQDGASTRRGRPSVAAKFGVATAICVGDHLLVEAFAHLASAPQGPGLVRLFGAGVSQMAAAQAQEFSPVLWREMTWDRYRTLVAGKAGAMVMLPVAGAALLAGLPASDVAALSRAAQLLGAAYQAGDDLVDLADDLEGGSLNGVIARALEDAAPGPRAQWLGILANARLEPLSAVEAWALAEELAPQGDQVRDWARHLSLATMTELPDLLSQRGQPIAEALNHAARALSDAVVSRRERRHAA